MKTIKWKVMILTALSCLLPIILGAAFYSRLPDIMPIHFNLNNAPDNYASKNFALFALPFIMMLFQIICCIVSDIKETQNGKNKKVEITMKSIVPFITLAFYTATVCYSLGTDVDIRKIALFIVGVLFIAVGNYLPKAGCVNSFSKRNAFSDKTRRLNRIIGYETVVLGIIFLISIFLPKVFSIVSLLLLIPYTIINLICAIKIK